MSSYEYTRALVTGASRGIGESITEKLLNTSFSVLGTAYNSAFSDHLKSHDYFEGVFVDLENTDDTKEHIKPLFNRENPPEVVVNNAGISEDASFDSTDESWLQNFDKTIRTNLKTPALICKWALNAWSRRSIPGIVINISSRAGYRGDTSEFASYAASKGGLAAFTKSIARSYGSRDITAFTIAPGFVDTDMAKEVKEVYGESYLKSDLALNELTTREDVAELAEFLATGKAKHMTGATFHINGGSYMV